MKGGRTMFPLWFILASFYGFATLSAWGSADRAGTPPESNGQMMIDSTEKWRLLSIDLELGPSGEQYMT